MDASLCISFKQRVRDVTVTIIGSVLIFVLLALYIFQDRLIYLRRRYDRWAAINMPEGVRSLEYTTREGHQVSFYRQHTEPREAAPNDVWIVFGGNASLALEWSETFLDYQDRSTAFLFMEYPGYGMCAGRPSPESILEASEAAFNAMCETWQGAEYTTPRIHVLGHSLGAAAGLQFASRHPVSSMVLIAPFTSMEDMALRRTVWPLHVLLRHRFDNRARLKEITGRQPVPRVDIFHGDKDSVIPFSMSRQLAAEFPMVRFHPIADGDHNWIIDQHEEEIFSVMSGATGRTNTVPRDTAEARF